MFESADRSKVRSKLRFGVETAIGGRNSDRSKLRFEIETAVGVEATLQSAVSRSSAREVDDALQSAVRVERGRKKSLRCKARFESSA
ncbi:MAG: hypothetical protein ACOY0T_26235, partial [Myxococcota bacterium]